MKNKRGQNQISFGMIFSIILIIVFIAFAIFGIVKVLTLYNFIKVKDFKLDLQEDIDDIWKGSGSQEYTYYLPKKIEKVCFIDDNEENMYFEPLAEYDGDMLQHIDIESTVSVSASNPKQLCIKPVNGKISLVLKRDYGQTLVTITK